MLAVAEAVHQVRRPVSSHEPASCGLRSGLSRLDWVPLELLSAGREVFREPNCAVDLSAALVDGAENALRDIKR